ncbi:MAG TPA: GNAT family N-acetyltransferase [Pedobacter sp.]|nr:GNAT family N-acetyltransferase [Pedobacter sp.]
MNTSIYLRPLTIADSHVSYHWRNNAEVWKFTNFNLAGSITQEIEENWLTKVLKMDDQRRFGICLTENDNYIGNVHLINIKDGSAEFHLVIGDMQYWRRGIGKEATRIILDYAFFEMCLSEINLAVDFNNHAAFEIYKKQGFVSVREEERHYIMRLTKEKYLINHPNYVI